MKGYQEIVPDMTEEETAFILEQLKLAREQAVDYKSMKQISAIFKAYKTKIELYFYEHGRNCAKCIKTMQKSERRKKQKKGNRESKILFLLMRTISSNTSDIERIAAFCFIYF